LSRLPPYLALAIIVASLASFHFGTQAQPLWLLVPPIISLSVFTVFYAHERSEGASARRSMVIASLASVAMSGWTLVLSAMIYGIGFIIGSLVPGYR
jgi:hypothetical protein